MLEYSKIAVIGLGVIGLPTAYLFSDKVYHVTGIDTDYKRVHDLHNGDFKLPDDLLTYKDNENITFTHTLDNIGVHIGIVIVCVGVDIDYDRNPLMEPFKKVIESVAILINRGTQVVSFETTVPAGTMINLVKPMLEKLTGKKCGIGFNLIYAPERVTMGRLIHNLTKLPRVIGSYSEACKEIANKLYDFGTPLNHTDLTTAEMVKLTENTYRDVNIAFANEVSVICDNVDVDFLEVRRLVNDLPNLPDEPRLNPVRNLHFAGTGVGGYCLPKDPHLLLRSQSCGQRITPSVINTARKLNDRMPLHIARKALIMLRELDIYAATPCNILLLGKSGIPNVNDTRYTPHNSLLNELNFFQDNANICTYDPITGDTGGFDGKDFSKFDVVILVTDHKCFDTLDAKIMKVLKSKRVYINPRLK